MNSDPNSVLSQNWLKCTLCTHPWPRLRARWALGRPCRGAPSAVSWPSPGRITAYARSCHGRVAGVSLHACTRWRAVSQRCVATQGRVVGPFRSQYKICIVTLALAARALRAASRMLPCVHYAPHRSPHRDTIFFF